MISVVNIIIELSCLITAIIFLKKDGSLFSILTRGYLAIVVIIETIGFSMSKGFHLNNAWLYNIFIIFEAAYISYGLYAALNKLTNKALMICSIPIITFTITYIIEIYNHGFLKFNSLTINLESVVFVVVCLVYFYLLIKQKDPIDLNTNAQFWWVSGVLFYYFGSTIYNLFIYFLYQDFPKSYTILIYVMLILNLLLYSIWIYSYICNSRQRKLLLSSY
ncbi:hypothetical protein [Pedobacter boryungensis]|uniref:Histidine kinase N-terminal 7TM region domain-containing protein n=1 Tax=Pedobacter boryungensis TaxID=869962 RepID=A0ABX2DEX6_9SPHI|nr:hypothetical protein [Pedobacter boryungensis]NQX31836.1 hypothetical protein [Pedobacter boryungensis]